VLKTLDILIGATTVVLLFSMAVTVITQALNNLFHRRGKHLKAGLANLLQQLGIPTETCANDIADHVLRHPMIADGKGNLGTVVKREEFVKLLLDFAGGEGVSSLGDESKNALLAVIQKNGIPDPLSALKNIRALELQLEASDPQLATDVRRALAIVHGAGSDFIARINSWYDETIDRVSQRFTNYTHLVTIAISLVVVVTVQLDIIAVMDRLSIDEQFRTTVVEASAKQFAGNDNTNAGTGTAQTNPKPYYDLLSQAGLIMLPTSAGWVNQLKETRKIPGMLLSVLLLSLGAPFWYSALKDLLQLRSTIAQKDDAQRRQRQSGQPAASSGEGVAVANATPAWLIGERGDLTAIG
jgi:hypothetical protein